MNLTPIIGIPLALFGALMLLARPAHAPVGVRRTPEKPHIASPEVTRQIDKGAYPGTVKELAIKWSKVFKVPVSWIRSQAYAESKNVLQAKNETSGAIGVLQILPNTARDLLKSIRRSKFAKHSLVRETLEIGTKNDNSNRDGDSLFNPDVNIMLATYYMALLRNKFGNDHDLVAAAYNIGPGHITRCIATNSPLPERSRVYLAMVKDAKRRGFV